MIFIDNQKRTDIYLKDYYLSDDNKFMNIEVGVSSSADYVRKIKNRIKGDNNYKLILVKDEFSQEWKKITNDIKIHFVSVFLLLLYFYFF